MNPDRVRVTATQQKTSFGASDEEGAAAMEDVQTLEVDVGAVHHVEGGGLGNDGVEDVDVVRFSFGNLNKSGNRAAQVEQGVHLDRRAGLATHPNPIYTQPVNAQGLSPEDPVFNAVAAWFREATVNGLPAGMAAEGYTQLLRTTVPLQNVVVASPHEPFATQGGNKLIEGALCAENLTSAVPFTGK